MSEGKESREEWLTRVVRSQKEYQEEHLKWCMVNYPQLRWASVLSTASWLPRYCGVESFFIEGDLRGLKQHFYVCCKLMMASEKEAKPEGDFFSTYHPFLYGLLSDSTEIYDWLAHAELKDKDYVKGNHFFSHQCQLVLRRDDAALRDTIAVVARQGGNRNKAMARAGQDFFSLLLRQDKEGLETLIEGYAKIKPAQELEERFLAGFAVVHAKLCWYRGIEVQIKNPLVPMALMPIVPLEAYDVEYDFLRPGWKPPPPPGLLKRIWRLLRR